MSTPLQAAGQLLALLDGVNLGLLGVNHGAVIAAFLTGQLAIAEETARLADEQHTANLIEYAKRFDWSDRIGERDIKETIRERLGIANPSSVPF